LNIQPIVLAVRRALYFALAIQDQLGRNYNKAETDNIFDPVTLADYGVQVIITRAIKATFPDDPIISEESLTQFQASVEPGRQKKLLSHLNDFLGESLSLDDLMQALAPFEAHHTSNQIWTIDPIDGTTGYINRRNFSVGVGLIKNGEASLGIIGVPAYRGGGVFYNDADAICKLPLDNDTAQSIVIPAVPEQLNIIVKSYDDAPHASHAVMNDVIKEAGISQAMIVRLDGMEKYLQVATGDADLYLRMPPLKGRAANKVWDHVPGVAIAKTVHAHILDKDGHDLKFNMDETMNNIGIIVARGGIIDAIIRQTSKIQYPLL